ncbi:MAG: hypothetical protein HGA47_14980 [Zoogloea sp.]|nr:hypothetical protein [Zoogloea sp.]
MNPRTNTRSAELDLSAYESRPELALVSVLTMMSQFPARLSPALAESIVGHLCLIADDDRHAEALRQCAAALIENWSNHLELARLRQSGATKH